MLKKIKITILLIIIFTSIFQNKLFANTVEYKGEAEGLIATPNDFFLNLGELLPGDTKQDIAYIKNSTNEPIEVFFKTEPLDKTEYYDEIDYSLLEKIKLTITLKQTSSSEEQLLYEGNLGAELMSEYISLGEYQKGYDGEFIFKIEVPTDLRNNYTLSTTKVKWVFAVKTKQEEENNSQNNIDTENKNDTSTDDKTNENPITQIVDIVKTSDNIYYMIGLLTIAIGIIIIMIIKKSRLKNEIINKKTNKK